MSPSQKLQTRSWSIPDEKRGILARYPKHMPGEPFLNDPEWDWYDSYYCQRCGRLIDDDDIKAGKECLILGLYEADNVLIDVIADENWLKDHADELSLFPPLGWISETEWWAS